MATPRSLAKQQRRPRPPGFAPHPPAADGSCEGNGGAGGLGFQGNQIRLGSRGRLTGGGVPGSVRRRTGQQLPAGERREAAAADEFFGREKRNQIGSQKSRAGNRIRDAGKRARGRTRGRRRGALKPRIHITSAVDVR